MEEHTITKNDSSLISELVVQTFNTTVGVNVERNYESYENDNIWVSQNERADLGRLLLNSVDDVDVVEETPAQEIADDTPTEETDVIGDTIVLDDFFGSEVEFITGSEVMIDDGSGGEVVLMGGETKKLYETLDEHFGEDDSEDDSDGDDGEITECLCGHDPYWEDHGLCPFGDDGSVESEQQREADSTNRGVSNDETPQSDDLCVCGNPSCDAQIAHEINTINTMAGWTWPDDYEHDDDSVDDDGVVTRDRNPQQREGSFPQCCAKSQHSETSAQTSNASVALATAVDVTEASDEQHQMYQDMARMVEDNYETFVNKNMSYGNSFLNTEVGLNEGGPFDSQLESNANGLMVRMTDKMTRLENILLTDSEDRVGEKAVETALDLANYSTMLAYLCQQNEGDN